MKNLVKIQVQKVRKIRLVKNTASALVLQVVTVLCGFILPRAILMIYGSEVNGVVNSISQFLQMIAFAELGLGAVIQSALYKPISENNFEKVSEIIAAGDSFFRKIGALLAIYVLGLCFCFPIFIDKDNSFLYDAILIIAISISFFAQYYFGLVDRLFMNAVQRAYIQNIIYIGTLIGNTIACYYLIYNGHSIQSVKFLTSIIFLLRPILVRTYIKRKYAINRKAKYTQNTINQKWNGVAQHISAIILDSTDTIVLSVLSTLINVSIYSVYNIVVSGLKQLFMVSLGGITPLMGELWAREEKHELNVYFEKTEQILHFVTIVIWWVTYKLITPFVILYTNGVNDANYDVPVFALIICLASAVYCIRMSYNSLILAAGHYKQTQNIFIMAAFLNLTLSIILVKACGLIGVAIGTLLATLYQHLHMQFYCIKKLRLYSYKKACKQFAVDFICIILSISINKLISIECIDWISWLENAVVNGIIILLICISVNIGANFKKIRNEIKL